MVHWQDFPVDDLEISVRAANCLRNREIKTLGQLVTWTPANIMRIENLGRITLWEIKESLASMSLWLGMTPEDIVQADKEKRELQELLQQPRAYIDEATEDDTDYYLRKMWQVPLVAPEPPARPKWPFRPHPRAEHALWLRLVKRYTYKEVGKCLGVSAMRASQLAATGLRHVFYHEYGRSYYGHHDLLHFTGRKAEADEVPEWKKD